MKKLFIAFLFLAAASDASFAQCGTGKNDPEAKKVLDGVSTKFKTFKSLQANISVKAENGAGKVISSKSGSLHMKGTKYRLSIAGQEIFCDGKNIWTYDKNANEVTIRKFDGSVNTITPQKIFTNFYDKDFLYKMNGETKSGSKTLQEIEMTPCDKTKTFHKVYLLVDKNSQTLSSTKVLEKNGNKYTYSVLKMNPNAAAPESLFSFDAGKYPGVEVVDLR